LRAARVVADEIPASLDDELAAGLVDLGELADPLAGKQGLFVRLKYPDFSR
jgi:hypothetical protein